MGGICETCRKKFFTFTAEKLEFIYSIMEELKALPQVTPRGFICSCTVCKIARTTGRRGSTTFKPTVSKAPVAPATPAALPDPPDPPDFYEPQPSSSSTPTFHEIMSCPLEVRE